MDIKKEMQQVKVDLAGYQYHCEKIDELVARYGQIRTIMSKIKSPNLDNPTTHTSFESIEPFLKQIEIKDNIIRQLRESLIIINRAERFLAKIKNENDKKIIVDAYIKGKYISDLARENYYSFNGMKKKLNSIIYNAIK